MVLFPSDRLKVMHIQKCTSRLSHVKSVLGSLSKEKICDGLWGCFLAHSKKSGDFSRSNALLTFFLVICLFMQAK